MIEKIENIISIIKERACNWEFINEHRDKETSFVRISGKIKPSDVIFFVLSLIKTTLDFEILHYCNNSDMEKVEASSISKARKKLSYTAFVEIFNLVANEIEISNKFKGYQVLAIDGMQGEMQKTPELMEKYNGTDVSYPRFHAVAVFDVLNKFFLSASFLPAPTDERKAAIELIENLPDKNDTIILVDRGFPSLALLQKFDKVNKKFVMRVSTGFLKELKEFSKSGKNEEIIHIDYDKARGRSSNVKGVELPYSFDLRAVNIILKNGEVETLITNLSKSEFSIDELGTLYDMRWKIETSYNHLKNAVHTEDFVGVLENSILQEFYASLTLYNIALMFKNEAQLIYDKKKEINKV